jgi:archaemetzincin
MPLGFALALWLVSCGAAACSPVEAAPGADQGGASEPRARVSEAPPPGSPSRRGDASADVAELVRRSVRLEILGDFPREVVPEIEAGLRRQLRVLPTLQRPLPAWAYYPPRKRYRAEKLLQVLEREQPARTSVLGMTEVDISTTKGKHQDWGVFGLGMIGGTSSVISTFRLRRGKPSAELYRFRIVSSAVHEVGHMLGLEHCTEPRCVMNDAEGSIKTVDASTGELGPRCLARLAELAPATRSPLP